VPVKLGAQLLEQLARRAHVGAIVIDVVGGNAAVRPRVLLPLRNAKRLGSRGEAMPPTGEREGERLEV
jgi:hypothetical protein